MSLRSVLTVLNSESEKRVNYCDPRLTCPLQHRVGTSDSVLRRRGATGFRPPQQTKTFIGQVGQVRICCEIFFYIWLKLGVFFTGC